MKKTKNLLIISTGFPNHDGSSNMSIFVKEQALALQKYFRNIYVIAPYPVNNQLTSRLIKLPPSSHFQNYRQRNIKVFYAKYFDLPLEIFKKQRARRWTKMAYKIIDNNKLKFDVIHGHFSYPGGVVAHDISARYHKPFVITAHENQDWLKNEMTGWQKKDLMNSWRTARAVIRVNKTDAIKLQKKFPNVCYIPNGIDTTKFKPVDKLAARQRLKLPTDKKIILCVGGFYKVKNQALLVEALPQVIKQNPKTLCILIGRGRLKKDLAKKAQALGLKNKNFKIINYQKNQLLPYWYSAADIYCVPSLHESFGIAQIEAMACGTPVVATKNGSSEQIIGNNSGIIAEKQNKLELAKCILKGLDSKWQVQDIQKNVKRYDIEKVVQDLVRTYRV